MKGWIILKKDLTLCPGCSLCRQLLRQTLHLQLEFAQLGGSRQVSTALLRAAAARLWGFSWGSVCHCDGGGVLRRQRGVQLWRLLTIIKRPEQREGKSHGQDLSHANGHAEETQHLQRLRPSNKTVDLWTAALKHKQTAALYFSRFSPDFPQINLSSYTLLLETCETFDLLTDSSHS